MARELFEAQDGIRLYRKTDGTIVDILFGSALPGGDSGDQDEAEIGSIYLRSGGLLYQKVADDGQASDWRPIISANERLRFHLASLSAFDKTITITHADQGLRTERISSVSYASSLYPDCSLTKSIYWLDVGLMNQRIDKVEYLGGVFAPDNLRQNYIYQASGIHFRRTGITYEIF